MRIAALWAIGTLVATGALGCAQVAGIEDVSSSAVAAHCVATVNQLRAGAMLSPVTRWIDEEECADASALAAAQGNGSLPACSGSIDAFAWSESVGGDPDAFIQSNVNGIWTASPGHGSMGQASLQKIACGFGAAGGNTGGALFFDP